MAQYGRVRITVKDASGNPVSGAAVSVRRQGVTVDGAHGGGSPPQDITVNDVGSLLDGDTVSINTGVLSWNATLLSATQVRLSGATVPALSNNDRIVPTNPLPTVYLDAQGAEPVGTFLTDSNGVFEFWAREVLDIKITSGSLPTPILLQDVIPSGERVISGMYPGAGPMRILDTLRTLNSTDVLQDYRNNTVSKAQILASGLLKGTKLQATTDGLLVDAGGVTVTAGGVTVTAGGCTIVAGGLTVSAGGATITGNVTLNNNLLFGADVNLYRSAANLLKTDDSLEVAGKITVGDRITRLSGFEDMASATTISVTKNNVRFTSDGGDVQTINIDGATPGPSHDGYELLLFNNTASLIAVIHNTGNIATHLGTNFNLEATRGVCHLKWCNSISKWITTLEV